MSVIVKKEEIRNLITELSKLLDATEKPSKSRKVELPWLNVVDERKCHGVVRNGGLFTQCVKGKEEGEYCSGCMESNNRSNNGEIMNVKARGKKGWRSDKGEKPLNYSSYLKKKKISRSEAEKYAESIGVRLGEEHFAKSKRGRKTAVVSDTDSEGDEKKRRGRPRKKKADAINDLLKRSVNKNVEEIALGGNPMTLFYGVIDTRKNDKSILWRKVTRDYHEVKHYKMQPKKRANSKGGVFKCKKDDIALPILVQVKDHINKNFQTITGEKVLQIVNQFKSKAAVVENTKPVVIEEVQPVVVEEVQPVVVEDSSVVVENTKPAVVEDSTVVVEDSTVVVEDSTTVVEEVKPVVVDDDENEFDLSDLDNDNDNHEEEDHEEEDHEEEDDEEEDESDDGKTFIDENDAGELDLGGNVSDFLEETDDEEEEETMKPFKISQSGFTFVGEIFDERTNEIEYTIDVNTNTVYDKSEKEVGAWDPSSKQFNPN